MNRYATLTLILFSVTIAAASDSKIFYEKYMPEKMRGDSKELVSSERSCPKFADCALL